MPYCVLFVKFTFIFLSIIMQTIFSHPNFEALSSKLAETSPNIHLWKLRFEHFADGWPNLFFEEVEEDIEHKIFTYIGDYSKKEYLFENYCVVRSLLGYYADKVRVIIPFFPVGTMERISKRWEVATSRYLADLLGHLPQGRTAKSSLHLFDLHTLEQRFFFNDFQVNAELHSLMHLIKEKISKHTTIVFPDVWAQKRFGNEFKDYPQVLFGKKRDGEERILTLLDGNPKDQESLIVDDLIQSGGTIIESAKLLRKLGASRVDAFASHGIFVRDAHIKVAQTLDTLYTTDSLPENVERAQTVENMEVLSIASSIAKILWE